MNSKPRHSAVIDKSLFHELCKVPDPVTRAGLWADLHKVYLLVLPPSLIEETLKNAVFPGDKPADEVERLVTEVGAHSAHWMEEIDEIVFQELVGRRQIRGLPPMPDISRNRIFGLRRDDQALHQLFAEGRIEAAEDCTRRKSLQAQFRLRIVAEGMPTVLQNERQFFEAYLKPGLLFLFRDDKMKQEVMEMFLGGVLRRRHPDKQDAIDAAFSNFTPETFTQFYVTLARLLCHMAYLWGPTFMLPGHPGPKFLKEEPNNRYDVDYVASAMVCRRFLTRDEQQARVARIFADSGFWKGKVVFLPPKLDIRTAIHQALEP